MDIVEFLTARIDEDEIVAFAAGDDVIGDDGQTMWVLDDDYKHDTIVVTYRRVLADVAAKRAILDRYQCVIENGPQPGQTRALDMYSGSVAALRDIIKMLAQPYVDHPDFDPSWRMKTAAN